MYLYFSNLINLIFPVVHIFLQHLVFVGIKPFRIKAIYLNLYFDCQAWNGQIKGYRVLFVPFPHHAQPSQSKLNTARLSAVIGTTTALTGSNCHRRTKKGN